MPQKTEVKLETEATPQARGGLREPCRRGWGQSAGEGAPRGLRGPWGLAAQGWVRLPPSPPWNVLSSLQEAVLSTCPQGRGDARADAPSDRPVKELRDGTSWIRNPPFPPGPASLPFFQLGAKIWQLSVLISRKVK